MKWIIFKISVFISFLTLININGQDIGQWQNTNQYGNYLGFQTIDFIDEDNGWIAGYNTLLKTEDGGQTWVSISNNDDLLAGHVGANFLIEEIDFVDETFGWVIVWVQLDDLNIGKILKSENGGQNWSAVYTFNIFIGPYIDYSLFAVDDSTAYISIYEYPVKDFLKIIKTENAGTSWIDISPYQSGQSLNSVWFQDEINGLFIGSTIKNDGGEYYPIQSVILKTRDGGQIWEEVVIPDFIEMYDLQHINDSTAYFLAKKGTSYEAEYLLCKTIDNLNTWTIVYQHVFHESSNINSFYCLDDMTLFAIMTDSSLTRSLMKSIDGGTTWVKQLANGWDGDDGEIYFKNDNIGIIAAGNFPYQTFDGGNNWTFQNFWYDLFGVHFIDENKGFAFGGGAGDHAIWGDLFITGNGGNTWSKAPNQPPTIIISCIFVDQMTGFILSRDGSYHCSKSIDGGQSWSELNKFNANFDTGYYIHSCNDIYFLDETNGWAVGRFGWTNESTLDLSGAGILGTYDGGENWDLVWTYPNPYNALTSIDLEQ